MAGKKISFPDNLKRVFKNFVAGRCGLYFRDDDMKNLEGAVVSRMKACRLDSIPAYYNCLTASDDKEDEFRELLNLLAINHTYFFRNEPQFRVLKEKVLPEVFRRKMALQPFPAAPGGACGAHGPLVRIWSTGCATGEEPYSIALMVSDLVETAGGPRVEICATDVSTSALDRAKAGIYRENSMRLVDAEHRKKYFVEGTDPVMGREYGIRDDIKSMVDFRYLNLLDPCFPRDFDIIFCRNIVMYFEQSTAAQVMDRIHSSLADDGYLFVGYSESLWTMPDKFKMEEWNDAIFYRRSVAGCGSRPAEPARAKPQELPREAARPKPAAGAKTPGRRAGVNAGEGESMLRRAARYMELKKLDEAKKQVHAVLNLDVLSAPAHYFLGTICMGEGKFERARESLKRAIYLDRDFTMAHFELANVYRVQGKTEHAIRERRNTLKLLERSSPRDAVPYGGGMNAMSLKALCVNSIERLETGG